MTQAIVDRAGIVSTGVIACCCFDSLSTALTFIVMTLIIVPLAQAYVFDL